MISGKIPAGLFRFLFGKGEYELTPNKTRLFGLFLASPLPAAFFVSFLLTALLGAKGTGYAAIFEIIYILIAIIASIIVARKTTHRATQNIENPQTVSSSSEQKTSRYGLRLLTIFGIGILGCVTTTAGIALIMVIVSSVTVGTRWTGNFWSDIFPFIIMMAVIGSGLFGILKLVQVLRK